MNRASRMQDILTQQLQPIHLELLDDSAKHAGHAGAAVGGETHYTLVIEAPCFAGLPKVKRHRMIYRLLTEEFTQGLHALVIQAFAPGQR